MRKERCLTRVVLEIGLGMVLSLSLFSLPILAQIEPAGPGQDEVEKEEPQEVGNKICPVSGKEIEETEAYKVEYQGKIYNLCCKICENDFQKAPEKYIEKLRVAEKEEPSPGSSFHEGKHTH